MFANPNIAAWVVERLPCTFAKPNPDGSPGTHYAMVLLDKGGNVLYIGSQCEHENGEGIQALHELGEANDTCFTSSAAFRTVLSKIHAAKGDALPMEPNGAWYPNIPPLLGTTLKAVWATGQQKHNDRTAKYRLSLTEPPDLKLDSMRHVMDRVMFNVLGLDPQVSHGRHQDRVHNTSFVKNEVTYQRIFQIRRKYFSQEELRRSYDDGHVLDGVKLEPGTHTVLCLGRDEGVIFAIRDVAGLGKWSFDPEPVKRWAGENYTVFNNEQKKVLGHSPQNGKDYCIFCGDWFERMSRHVSGAKHIDRVVEVAKLACLATSRTGLKMLNSPRHRSAFLKDRK